MRRFDSIGIGEDYLSIDRYPWYWWPVKEFLHLFCKATGCRFCMSHLAWKLDHKFLNSPHQTLKIPMSPELRVEIAKAYGIELTCYTWLDDEEDDHLCELPALHEGEHFDSDTGRRWT